MFSINEFDAQQGEVSCGSCGKPCIEGFLDAGGNCPVCLERAELEERVVLGADDRTVALVRSLGRASARLEDDAKAFLDAIADERRDAWMAALDAEDPEALALAEVA